MKEVDVASEDASLEIYESGSVKAEASSIYGLLMGIAMHLHSEGISFVRLKDSNLVSIELRLFEVDKPS